VGEDKSSSSKIVLSVTDGKLSILWKINVKANKKNVIISLEEKLFVKDI
jgi:hypothetical protein